MSISVPSGLVRQAKEALKLRRPGRPRKGHHIANILHTGDVHEHALKTEAEARMRCGAVLSKLQVPPISRFGQLVVLELGLEQVQALFALTATDDLPNARR
jgi:hypothetical protein